MSYCSMLSRAGENNNVKSILGFHKSVSGHIDSSASVPRVLRFSFSLSRLLSPFFSFLLSFSFLPSVSLLPSFLPSVITTLSSVDSLGKNHPFQPHRAYFMFVRSRKNLHTCKLPLAGSRSPIVKYA